MLKRRRPLLRAADVENLAAGLNHTAINSAGYQWRNLPGGDRNHRFVEQSHSSADLATANQGTPLALYPERSQIMVVESPANLGDSFKGFDDSRRITLMHPAVSLRQKQISLFDAIWLIGKQAVRTR